MAATRRERRIIFARAARAALIYGRATQEIPDRADEEMDYEGSKPYFQRWSKSQLEASFGKSAGNVREMHSKTAAGILVPENGITLNDREKFARTPVSDLPWSEGPTVPGTATLAWDLSPAASVSGYRIYYGTAPGAYFQRQGQGLNVRNVKTHTITGT
jgi:hypothetical protein